MGSGDDVADCPHRLVALRPALITRQIDLDEGGLAVGALGAGGGDEVAPVILDVLDVCGVGLEFADQSVVVLVCVRTEGLVTFQHDHGQAVGVELVELLPKSLHRDE